MYLLNEFANRYVKEQYKKRKVPFKGGGNIYTKGASQKEEYKTVKNAVLDYYNNNDPNYKYKNQTADLYAKLQVKNNTNNIKYSIPSTSNNAGSFKDLSKVKTSTTVTTLVNQPKITTNKIPKTKLLTKTKLAIGITAATGIGLLAANKLRKTRSDKNKKRNKYNKRK